MSFPLFPRDEAASGISDREEPLGIMQVLDRLERFTETLPSK